MSHKDYFNRSSQVVVSSSLKTLGDEVESADYITEYNDEQVRLEPHIDFSDPANFAKYGSAQEYYDKSLKYIYGEYPYDGSLKEKLEWRNDATLIDLYILDNRYPKSTGYGILSSNGWGTLTGSLSGGYGAPATGDYEYINIKGGPNSSYGASLGTSSLSDIFDSKSNIWDQTVTGSSGPVSAKRESNLQTSLDTGVTVEFWLQTGSLGASLTEKQVVFDLWNGELSSSAGYGRLRIELTGSAAVSPFLVTVMSGTDGYSQQSIGSGLDHSTLTDWGHYAVSFANSGSTIVTRLYKNGVLNDTLTTGTSISDITEDIEANIGALVAPPSGNVYHGAAIGEGWGKLSGSIDDFRFWKTRRTGKEIGRYWFTSELGGGTNTDTANLDLGIYYKFNEGITQVSTTDDVVLDYSGRISNGTWTGYPGITARNTGSAIVSASAGTEGLEPIIRSNHPDVTSLNAELQLSGSLWDYENNSSLYFTMPSWIIDEDEANGTTGELRKLTQIMASYLDNLDLLVGELPKLNVASYPSGSTNNKMFKPYPYAQTAVHSFGLVAPELFSNGNILEYYLNRDETKEYEEDLNTIKNLVYNNIYNNLTDIYKAKGTEKAFRNLIRCFGIGDDVIRINAYADNSTYKFETKRRAGSHKTKAINFNHVNNFAGTVYQYADTSNTNSVSYISGSSTAGLSLEDGFPITLEAEVIFPKKISRLMENASSQEFPHLTASLFGIHTARATSPTETDLTWAAADSANFQVVAVRDQIYSDDVRFMLTSSNPFPVPELVTSYYQNTYDNQKWNFAVRIKPTGYPQSFTSGALDNNYVVEFYGVNYVADRKLNEFTITGSIPKATAESLLTSPKRVYIGSHKTNFTGSTLQYTDARVTSCRYWFDYLDNAAIQNHAIDPGNFGHPRPNRDTYLLESDLPSVQVPKIESLVLFWDFETVTGTDNGSGVPSTFDGKFTVQDVTSGSVALTSRYNWLGKILKYQHTGRGDAFPINSTDSVENQYLYAAKQQLPEIVFGDDNIRVLNQEETEIFTKETRPTKTYYAFEKSMYQVVSDEIINYFGSIADFNNLIGDPVNRYRHEYKDLNYLRQFFFERVTNTPDLDKFIDYYKWIDATLETMLMQLVPASAQHSDGIDNIVESHVLERSKYQSKFPTLEFNTPDPEAGAVSINEHLYDWRRGHRPISGEQSDNCLYWKERAERDDTPISSGDTNVDSDRNKILSASLQVLNRSFTTPYKYAVEKNNILHGGINYSENKKTDFYRGINFPHGPMTSIGLPENILTANNLDVVPLEDCDDESAPNQKKKYSFGTINGRSPDSGSYDGIKGEIAMPFNILSASQGIGGYNSRIQDKFLSGSQLVNLHSDGYGIHNEVPMQGPFTEKHVGGYQHRHIKLNSYDPNRTGGDGAAGPNNLDGQYTRPEAWRLNLGGGPGGSGSIGLTGPDYGGPYPDPTRYRAWWIREETAKRPINIRNIQNTTSSIGNYDKTYQFVQTSGRSTNNFWFNDNGATLPERYAANNPTTTNVHTLVGVRPYTQTANRRRGNTFLPGTNVGGTENVAALRRVGNRFYPYKAAAANETKRTVFPLPDRTKQDAVIVERFSAPGGPEINSLGFLDIMAAEKSVYNALPWRNLTVVGSGSGEEIIFGPAGGTIKVDDHLGKRRGLRTLAALHAGPFGSDGTYGSITANNYVTSPSFYKINRNARYQIEGTEGSYSTASVYDNWYIQHPLPQNDVQYSWINGSILSGTLAHGHAPKSGQVSGSNAFAAAITFLSSSGYTTPNGAGSGGHIDFVGINAAIYDQTGSAFNILSSSLLTDYRTPTDGPAPGGTFIGANIPTIFNALMLHRNGPYGYSSWRQTRGEYHSLVRQMRANNTISVINPDTTRSTTRVVNGYRGYKWSQLKTTEGIFGQADKVNIDRAVLAYHEPAVIQKYKVLEFEGHLSGVPAKIKASYANQKTYFTNSKLNQNLDLKEDGNTAGDITIGAFTDSGNRLVNVRYSETVYPKASNVYRPYIRERTTYNCSFWRDSRADRDQSNVLNSQGASIPSQSMWTLDARIDIASTAIVRTAVNKSEQGEGELQNSLNTAHSPYPGTGAPGGTRDITGSATYNRRHMLTTGSSTRSRSSAFGQSVVLATFASGDAPWDAGSQSGKNPFYNSYSEYAEEMKRLGKDYSILPEYRMSERMDYMIKDGGDLFDDSALFNLTGALTSTTSSQQNDFYKIYSHSDFMKYFDVVKNDLIMSSSLPEDATEITVRCKALLKLLPYEGFYPANRTLQLASLFSQSYGANITMAGAGATYREAGMRPFLTPMFAPGVLFNTIKSGIAVDFPILTPTNPLTITVASKGYQITNTQFSHRIPFEALIEPEAHIANIDIIDIEPHPSCSINATASWNGVGDDRYKMAMHNFLAETPDFFLENGTFSSFFSKPQGDWTFVQGTTYKMRVKIKKSDTNETDASSIIPQIVSGSETICMYSRPTAFGPPCQGGSEDRDIDNSGLGGNSLLGYNAPFTPPYYDGSAWVDIEYTPTTSQPSLETVLGELTSSYLRYSSTFGDPTGGSDTLFSGPQSGSVINDNAVQISASVNLFGKSGGLSDLLKYTAAGQIDGENQWVIQTKYETPILNFIDTQTGETVITNSTPGSGGAETRPYGMWHQYGRLPSGSEGITLEILDVDGSGSLADAVGFAKTSEKLGKVAASKTIREAVVAVPFIEYSVSISKTETANQRQFFSIDKRQIDTAVNGFETGPSANLSEAPVTVGESVRQMVGSMQRYVFPPSMDFLSYPDEVDPFSMYIFEFEHKLNQQDLVDIWQNLPPRIGRAFNSDTPLSTKEIMQTKEITHRLGDDDELLKNPGSKLQWMVFKVKQKAQTNYWRKTVTNNPDIVPLSGLSAAAMTGLSAATMTTDFINGGAGKGGVEKAGEFLRTYNWPYDFFSLVELAKIEEDVVYGTPISVTIDRTIADGGLTQEGVTDTVVVSGRTRQVAATVDKTIADGGLTQAGVQGTLGDTNVAASVNVTTTITTDGVTKTTTATPAVIKK